MTPAEFIQAMDAHLVYHANEILNTCGKGEHHWSFHTFDLIVFLDPGDKVTFEMYNENQCYIREYQLSAELFFRDFGFLFLQNLTTPVSQQERGMAL